MYYWGMAKKTNTTFRVVQWTLRNNLRAVLRRRDVTMNWLYEQVKLERPNYSNRAVYDKLGKGTGTRRVTPIEATEGRLYARILKVDFGRMFDEDYVDSDEYKALEAFDV